MDTHIAEFMQNTIHNLQKAIQQDNADLTWAVIKNLQDVVGSYENAAHAERNKLTKGRQ